MQSPNAASSGDYYLWNVTHTGADSALSLRGDGGFHAHEGVTIGNDRETDVLNVLGTVAQAVPLTFEGGCVAGGGRAPVPAASPPSPPTSVEGDFELELEIAPLTDDRTVTFLDRASTSVLSDSESLDEPRFFAAPLIPPPSSQPYSLTAASRTSKMAC